MLMLEVTKLEVLWKPGAIIRVRYEFDITKEMITRYSVHGKNLRGIGKNFILSLQQASKHISHWQRTREQSQ